jgi:hypothetical protein
MSALEIGLAVVISLFLILWAITCVMSFRK